MTQNPNWPLIDEAVSFPSGPNTTPNPPLWVSIKERSEGTWSSARGRQYELDRIQTGTWNGTYRNDDGALSAQNASGPFYPLVTLYRGYRKRAQCPATVNVLTASQATAGHVTYDPFGDSSVLAAGTLPTNVDGNYALTTDGTGNYKNTVPSSPVASTVLCRISGWSMQPGNYHTASVTVSSTASITLQVIWVVTLANGTTVSTGGSGSPVTVTSTPVRLSAPAQLSSNGVGAYAELIVSSGSAACTVTHNTWQLEYANGASAYTQPNAWYPVFTGLASNWPQDWDQGGTYGTVGVSGTDIFGWLSQRKILSPAYQEILVLTPSFLYCLDESQDSSSFYDATGNRPPMAAAYYYGVGAGANGSVTGGTQLTSPASAYGIGGPVVTFTNTAASRYDGILNLGATGTIIGPPLASAWTRVFAFRCPAPGTSDQIIWSTFDGSPTAFGTIGYSLVIQATTGLLEWLSSYNGGASTASVTSAAGVADGNWHTFAVAMASDGKTANTYLDGPLMGTATTASDMRPQTTSVYAAEILGALVGLGAVAAFGYTGDLALVGELPFAATANQVGLIASTFTYGGSGFGVASSASRWADILRWGNFLGPQSADNYSTGETVSYGPSVDLLAARGQTGTDVVSALQTVVTTENGNGYPARDGTVTLNARRARYNTTPVVIFGEQDVASGEIPYTVTGFGFDPTRIGNDASVTQTVTNNVVRDLDNTSVTTFGDVPITRTANTLNPYELSDYAQYLTNKYKNPQLRLVRITVAVSSYTLNGAPSLAAWLACLGLEVGSPVQVNRRPPNAPIITLNGFIEQINWSMADDTTASVDFQISCNNNQQFWEVGSSHTTLKNAVTSVGATTCVINPLPGSATNPIQADISSAGNLYEWVIDWGTASAEYVTVVAPTPGSSGYTSATLTIGTCRRVDTGATGSGFRFTHAIGAVLQDIGGGSGYSTALLNSYIVPANALDTYSTLDTSTICGY